MKRYYFNKLIRSKLPERMNKEGISVVGRHLNHEEFTLELKNKLVEEAVEVREADSREMLIKELSDVMEVIESVMLAYDIGQEELWNEQINKRKTNGIFLPENFVDYIEVSYDNHKVIEYLANRNRPYTM